MLLSKNKIQVISFLVFIFLFLSSLAWAAELPRLSQRKIRHSIVPGQSGYGEIVVDNASAQSISLRLYLEDWSYASGGDGTKEFAPANSTRLSCAAWIIFSPAELIIPAYGQQKVNYTVKVPAEAKGGYYAVLFFETGFGKIESPAETAQKVELNLMLRLGVSFYIEAKGTIIRTGAFENLELVKEKDSENLSIKLDFHNTGNVDITAGGKYHIMDAGGTVYSRGEFSDAYTLGGETAKLKADLKQPLSKGKYDLILTLDTGKALKETNSGKVPIITREVEIEINEKGEVVKTGKLKE